MRALQFVLFLRQIWCARYRLKQKIHSTIHCNEAYWLHRLYDTIWCGYNTAARRTPAASGTQTWKNSVFGFVKILFGVYMLVSVIATGYLDYKNIIQSFFKTAETAVWASVVITDAPWISDTCIRSDPNNGLDPAALYLISTQVIPESESWICVDTKCVLPILTRRAGSLPRSSLYLWPSGDAVDRFASRQCKGAPMLKIVKRVVLAR